ncbi:uncharacterized protein MYCFIDRAFT_179920 [Pseudocercospora fijiensis CIRAD86]|uniref:Uncharacterized protein n=1 Tax=Pseudocercospora fijiensis (strain CIRAD86) TaxID=383855 RepID=M2ZE02_PSEFD|nr:uncharacterized protein MYCFIDRAFT_179920 [Pseudocercospora fijiensis CIRAD86]EME77344.1 hypothetical protein MYCFIDRAFT_179920 [Pseudocercospora fijiensis CIRAD86]
MIASGEMVHLIQGLADTAAVWVKSIKSSLSLFNHLSFIVDTFTGQLLLLREVYPVIVPSATCRHGPILASTKILYGNFSGLSDQMMLPGLASKYSRTLSLRSACLGAFKHLVDGTMASGRKQEVRTAVLGSLPETVSVSIAHASCTSDCTSIALDLSRYSMLLFSSQRAYNTTLPPASEHSGSIANLRISIPFVYQQSTSLSLQQQRTPSNLGGDDSNQGSIPLFTSFQARERQEASSASSPTSSSPPGPPRTTTVNSTAITLVNNEFEDDDAFTIVSSTTAPRPRRPQLPTLGEELHEIYELMPRLSSLGPSWLQDPCHNAMIRVSQKLRSDSFPAWIARLQFRYVIEQLSYHTDNTLEFDHSAFRGWLHSFGRNLAHMENLDITVPEAPIANACAQSINPTCHNSNPHCRKFHYVYLLRITVLKGRYRIHYCSRGSDDGACPTCSKKFRDRACWWKAAEILRVLVSAFGRVGVTLLPNDPRHVDVHTAVLQRYLP